tara:strand:+ start:270 stop:755 length:486 start_codon:yes stop_codon:yes gene_type:complete
MDICWEFKKNDDWETPIEYWKIITPFLDKKKTILDPFYMNGNAKLKWEELGYKCIHENRDFFSYNPEQKDIIIVSNPPYSKRNEVLKRLIYWNIPFIMLMPITTICYIKTQRILKDKDIQIIIPNVYKGFIDKDGNGTKCPPFYLCYICYGMKLEKDINYL